MEQAFENFWYYYPGSAKNSFNYEETKKCFDTIYGAEMADDEFLFYWRNYDHDHSKTFSKKEVWQFYKEYKAPLYEVKEEEKEVVREPRYPDASLEVALIVFGLGIICLFGVVMANLNDGKEPPCLKKKS